ASLRTRRLALRFLVLVALERIAARSDGQHRRQAQPARQRRRANAEQRPARLIDTANVIRRLRPGDPADDLPDHGELLVSSGIEAKIRGLGSTAKRWQVSRRHPSAGSAQLRSPSSAWR